MWEREEFGSPTPSGSAALSLYVCAYPPGSSLTHPRVLGGIPIKAYLLPSLACGDQHYPLLPTLKSCVWFQPVLPWFVPLPASLHLVTVR